MANLGDLELLKSGTDNWNDKRPTEFGPGGRVADLREARLREAHLSGADLSHVDLRGADLRGADLRGSNLVFADLKGANLSDAKLGGANLQEARLDKANLAKAALRDARLHNAKLREANLIGADLGWAALSWAHLGGATLRTADLYKTNLYDADLTTADLSGANLQEADLSKADLTEAILQNADLSEANLTEADLSRASLIEAKLMNARLVSTDLRGADLSGCSVYGISAWDIRLDEETKQANLIITPPRQPAISVDNLEVAQFMYLLLNYAKIRDVIDTLTTKAVLILGRFTKDRMAVLDALREALRRFGYLPILFDFDRPGSRDVTETVSTLAHLARFIIADITDPKSIPQELMMIIPFLPSVPVQPLLLEGCEAWGMFEHFPRYPWVLPVHRYHDQASLIANLEKDVIFPAEAKAKAQKPPRP